jgi:microcystin-dependent protein
MTMIANGDIEIADFRGLVLPYAGSSAPTGWLLCDGAEISRTTYSDLFALIGTTYGVGNGSTTFNIPDLRGRVIMGVGTGTKVATFASRSSNVITVTGLSNKANNEFQTGQAVVYHTTGSVITGLSNDATYYVVRTGNLTFSLASSLADAQNGSVITLSGDGTGTQTFTLTLAVRALGDTGGEENHAMSSTELLAHTHTVAVTGNSSAQQGYPYLTSDQSSETRLTSVAGNNAAMNNMQPFVTLNYIIKY